MKHIEFKLQTADSLQLFAREWLPESEALAVVCLIHGKGEHSGRYLHTASTLTMAGYIVLTYDLRGHGKSQGKRGHSPSYKALMDDISLILNEAGNRFPNLPHFLYGHSLGGNLVLNYVLRRRHRLNGVIATSPWLSLASEPPRWKLVISSLLYNLLPSFSMTGDMDNQSLSRDSEVVNAYENDPLVHDRISVRLALDIIHSGAWVLEHASGFSIPLLIMNGSADRLISTESCSKFADSISGDCTYKPWEGLFHEIHNEPEKQEVFDFMIKWLKNHH